MPGVTVLPGVDLIKTAVTHCGHGKIPGVIQKNELAKFLRKSI